jgi:uncharacterized RDD family membrane protein YckC
MEYEDRLRIATPEGVDLELTLAGIGSRFIAATLDLMVQGTVLLAAAILLGVTGGGAGGVATAAFAIVSFLVFFAYDVLFEVRSRGRTLGKRWTGLRVVRTGGSPVTFVPSSVRNVMRLVDILPLFYAVGMFSIFFTSRNQRLGDLAAGTLVVHAKAVVLHDAPPPAETLAPAKPLNAREQAAILSWAGRAKRLTPARFEELAALAAPALRPVQPDEPRRAPSERLLGVAQWLMGRRA